MHADTTKYNRAQGPADRAICQLLAKEIDRALPDAENKSGTRIRSGSSTETPSSATAS